MAVEVDRVKACEVVEEVVVLETWRVEGMGLQMAEGVHDHTNRTSWRSLSARIADRMPLDSAA